MKTLVVVESPAKCRKIESYLGENEYTCVASYGHFRQLASLKDINDVFNITFVEMDEKKKYIKALRTAINKAKSVILATDDDREGEAIAWHICDAFGLDVCSTPRIVFQEITETALRAAVTNPGRINMDIVNAQHTRQIVDMALGFKISPLLWKAITRKSKTGLSAGRCQTPALKLVFDNNAIVSQHPGSLSYSTTGYFTSKNIPFDCSKNHGVSGEIESFLEETVNFDHILVCSEPTDVTKRPPVPLITSSLQQYASSNLGYSPKETMALCQKLYENGYITYMRTDSAALSQEFIVSAMEYIVTAYGGKYANKDMVKDVTDDPDEERDHDGDQSNLAEAPGGAQEAHEAIRPTDVSV